MTVPRIKWLSQRDNINSFTGEIEAHNQCMVSSFVMMMQWLRDYLIYEGLQSFENYNEFTHYIVVGQKKELAQKIRFISANHANQLNKMLAAKKINEKFVPKLFDYSEIIAYEAEKKRPVLIGTMETSAGHIVVYDGQIQNPYGNPSRLIHNGSCRYDSVKGDNLDYSKDFFVNMVFREMQNKKTSKIDVKRPCWVIE